MQNFLNKMAHKFGTTASPGGVLLWLLRGAFGAIVIGVAYVAFQYYNDPEHYPPSIGLAAFAGVILSGVVVVALDMSIRSKEITTVSAIYFGLLLGFLLGTLFSTALAPFVTEPELLQFLRLLVTLICCYISVSVLLQTKDEFRFIIP